MRRYRNRAVDVAASVRFVKNEKSRSEGNCGNRNDYRAVDTRYATMTCGPSQLTPCKLKLTPCKF